MRKIGVCGHFGKNKVLINGQTIKTKILVEELKSTLGKEKVIITDTYNWKKSPLLMFLSCIKLLKNCSNVIILPAQNGIKVFAPLMCFFGLFFNVKLHYVVIGGWLPKLLTTNTFLRKVLSRFNGIYVETNYMIRELNKLGLTNVRYLPNFKRLNICSENDLEYHFKVPYKLCIFSRVMQEKGIEDAIKVISNINRELGKTVYTLDIYGPIEELYKNRFKEIVKSFPDYINYKGTIDYDKSVSILKNYFALLFPTKFKTEGIPGTILDAYAAGLPVVVSEWDSAREIVDDSRTGYIYEFLNDAKLEKLLIEILNNPNKIIDLKKECITKAKDYLPDKAIFKLNEYLNLP